MHYVLCTRCTDQSPRHIISYVEVYKYIRQLCGHKELNRAHWIQSSKTVVKKTDFKKTNRVTALSAQPTFLWAAPSSSPCSHSRQTPSARGQHGPCWLQWAELRSGDTETLWWRSQGHHPQHLPAAPQPGRGIRRWRWLVRLAPGGAGEGLLIIIIMVLLCGFYSSF